MNDNYEAFAAQVGGITEQELNEAEAALAEAPANEPSDADIDAMAILWAANQTEID